MTIFIIVLLILSLGVSIVFGHIQYKARIKNQKMMLQMLYKSNQALRIMQMADKSGAFQSDDQVGETFVLLTTAIEELRNYFVQKIGTKTK